MNRILKTIAPTWALKREISRMRSTRLKEFHDDILDKRRSFDTVAQTRQRTDFLSENRSADSAIHVSARILRAQVRHLEQNTGNVSGPIQRMTDNVVGDGIKFQSAVRADDVTGRNGFPTINETEARRFRTDSEWGFKLWVKQADQRLMHDWHRIVRLAFAAMLRDGAVLIIGRISTRKNRIIPYTNQLLEIDRLQTPAGESLNSKVRGGVEFDDEGVPKTYYVLKNHPGDLIGTVFKDKMFEEIPAFFPNGNKKVIHLFNPIRPEQTIGYTVFAAALRDILDGDRYMDAEKMAALEDACMTAIVTTPNPSGFMANFGETPKKQEGAYQNEHEFGTNEMWVMKDGEEVDIHSPSRPNSGMRDYMELVMAGPANALNMPPEEFSQNFKGLSYSNARTILNKFYGAGKTWLRLLITDLCVPVAENVIGHLIIKGKVQAPGFIRRQDDYLASTWMPMVFRRALDPKKEADGKKIDLQTGVETLTDMVEERGRDFDDHIEKRARELKKMQDMEKKYDIEFPKAQPAASAGQNVEEKKDEDQDVDLEDMEQKLNQLTGPKRVSK